ncbi:FixH family protein [uncultured Rhodospira sp.]|uniref:FixH family protein n=1 Tax=uncultured Rhodospira sp. TaxID=1936189 RepID=UPI002619F40E|nr:FixH family protein [uncultured Rhodospira sp.]
MSGNLARPFAKTSAKSRARPRGWWIPYAFVAGFAVVLIANGTLLYFALTTFSGLSTQQAYVKGLAYNDRVADAQAQAALGWSWDMDLVAVDVPQTDPTRRIATVRASGRDAAGNPLDGAALTATIRRPTEQGFDQTVTLPPVGPGAYEARVSLPKPGQWDILLTARRNDDVFTVRRRLMAE